MSHCTRVSVLAVIGLLPLAAPAMAGPLYRPAEPAGDMQGFADAPAADQGAGSYGGGFVEFLMTGRSTPAPRGTFAMRHPGMAVATAVPAEAMQQTYGYAPEPEPTPSGRPQPGYAAPRKAVDPMFVRQEVPYDGPHAPGTVVIDTSRKFLYLVEAGGQALRYGIGVGRPGFLWSGEKTITRKAEWPDWTPPAEMLKRRPDLPSHMEGGITNPLGARAMYLGSTLYRIHGTNEPDTIGSNVSSGCIRLTNDDVTDLFGRVKVGTHVIVM